MYSTQYLAPFAWINAAIWCGISVCHCSGVMIAQVGLIMAFSSFALLGLAHRIFFFFFLLLKVQPIESFWKTVSTVLLCHVQQKSKVSEGIKAFILLSRCLQSKLVHQSQGSRVVPFRQNLYPCMFTQLLQRKAKRKLDSCSQLRHCTFASWCHWTGSVLFQISLLS